MRDYDPIHLYPIEQTFFIFDFDLRNSFQFQIKNKNIRIE